MADVFISYAREDQEVAARLARLLEERGFTVFFKRSVVAGQNFDEPVAEAIASASAVLVLWSAHSVNSRWVRDEAEEAQSHGKFLPVRVEPVDIPLGFRHINTADLDFRDQHFETSAAFTQLTNQLRFVAAGGPPVSRPPITSSRRRWRLSPPPQKRREDDVSASEPTKAAVNSPRQVGPAWETIRAYIYPSSAEAAVREDAQSLRPAAEAQHTSAQASVSRIKAGTLITVIIDASGAECRHTHQRFTWRGRWHKTDFQVRYLGEPISQPQLMNVSWFAGIVCIGQVSFHVQFTNERQQPPASPSLATAPGYESVFVSYSTKDSTIVDWLETTYTALGMTYLRDIKALRSGETWDKQLLKLIERADLFQLCWSANAKQSSYVADEWQFALEMQKPNFIRPCYWEDPMPEPPPELQRLHFARLKLNWFTRTWFGFWARFG